MKDAHSKKTKEKKTRQSKHGDLQPEEHNEWRCHFDSKKKLLQKRRLSEDKNT
jgi:hypothetical protein